MANLTNVGGVRISKLPARLVSIFTFAEIGERDLAIAYPVDGHTMMQYKDPSLTDCDLYIILHSGPRISVPAWWEANDNDYSLTIWYTIFVVNADGVVDTSSSEIEKHRRAIITELATKVRFKDSIDA